METRDSVFGQAISWCLVNAVILLGLGFALGWWTLAWIIVAVNCVLFLLHLGWRANH